MNKRQWEGEVPPHDLQSERAVLTCCLIDPKGITKVIDKLGEKSFYEYRNQLIYNAISTLFRIATPIDMLTVATELEKTKALEKIGGQQYLCQLSMELATSSHAEAYAKTVRDFAVKRELRLICQDTNTKIMENLDTADNLISGMIDQLIKAHGLFNDGTLVELQKAYIKVITDYEDQDKDPANIISYMTGYDLLDDMSDGFRTGNFVVIAAPSGMGKSDLMMNMALRLSRVAPVAIFSLEMRKMDIITRMIAMENNCNSKAIRRGRAELTKEFYQMGFDPRRIFIDDKRGVSIPEIRAKASLLIARYGVKIVFIDHKEKIRIGKEFDSEVSNRRAIPQELSVIAADLDVVIILVAQPTLAGQRKKKMTAQDIRDAGFEDADIIYTIYRPQYQKEYQAVEIIEVSGGKDRHGSTGMVKLKYESHSGKISNDDTQTTQAPLSSSIDEEDDDSFNPSGWVK